VITISLASILPVISFHKFGIFFAITLVILKLKSFTVLISWPLLYLLLYFYSSYNEISRRGQFGEQYKTEPFCSLLRGCPLYDVYCNFGDFKMTLVER